MDTRKIFFKLVFISTLSFISVLSAESHSENCGGVFTGYQYTITSPSYPRNYPESTECVYTLRGFEASNCVEEFQLQFLEFDVKSSDNCNENYLLIGDHHVFCGNISGLKKFTGDNNSLKITFHSDKHSSAKGFKILVTALPCEKPKLDNTKNESLNKPSLAQGSFVSGESTFKDNRNGVISERKENPQLMKNAYYNYRPNIDFTAEDDVKADRRIQRPINDKVQLSSYVFLPPAESDYKPKGEWFRENSKSITPPSKDLLLPAKNAVPFRNPSVPSNRNATGMTYQQVNQRRGQVAKLTSKVGHRINSPSEVYGEPGVSYYDPQGGTEGDPDCDRNEVSSLGGTSGINNDPAFVVHQGVNQIYPQTPEGGYYDPNVGPINANANYYPGDNYNRGLNYPNVINNPGLNYPNGINNLGINYPSAGFSPSIDYPNYVHGTSYPNSNYYPNGNYYPSSNYPNVGYPNRNYKPNYNPSGSYPGYVPGINNGYYPGVGRNYECCGYQNSNRRFFITSPGFPSSGVNSNSYECGYTIRKSSQDVCRLRLNLKFFNYGAEEQFCANGYLEIDGRRYCGCKTGQSIVVPFTYVSKTINVRYVGHQQTKFNGFFIEVIQESCGNIGSYPFISRRSDVVSSANNTLISNRSLNLRSDQGNSTQVGRVKRNLGYSYIKPSVPFPKAEVEHIKSATHDRVFLNNCQARVFLDFVVSAKEAFFTNSKCGRTGGRSFNSPGIGFPIGCGGVNGISGYPTTQRYPYNYPNYGRLCNT